MVWKKDGSSLQGCYGIEGGTQKILGYVKGNGLINRLYIVQNIQATLISVTTFTQRDMPVSYNKNTMDVTYQKCIIFQGEYDPQIGLYVVKDLAKLLKATDPRPTIPTSYNTTRSSRFTPRAIRMAREFHAATKHIPYSTMARMVEQGTQEWANVHASITAPHLHLAAT